MLCKRVTEKKYRNRPSPPYHANNCKGKTMKGNDGTMYKSIPNRRGIHTWKRGGKLYFTHNNGSEPFAVEDFPKQKRAIIYKNTENGKEQMMEMKYLNIWFSEPSSKRFGDWKKGNSVLIQQDKHTYSFVGSDVFRFSLEADDKPLHFMSPIGNNDVPYPYLLGEQNIYFFNRNVYLPISLIDTDADVYDQLYGINEYSGNGLEAKAKKINIL